MNDPKAHAMSSGNVDESRNPALLAAAKLCMDVLPVWMRHLQTSKDQSENAVREMLSAFGPIERYVSQAAPGVASEDIQSKVEAMYVALQYQDRFSQMLQLLQLDMERLLSALLNPAVQAADFKSDDWLNQLASQYAMAEQRRDHAGQVPGDVAEGDGTSFF